ncbi:hypothetical protein BG006_003753 [Podila minutissima]|uniref:Uncharacterized protein n=1 Tax=Podila minutissima TaxID=64525 RepID=A0A9P5SLY1_9FUNG|nr:hypothetical protein BG006_003753 [Podila minutissima]
MDSLITKYLPLRDVVACVGGSHKWRARFTPCLWSGTSLEEVEPFLDKSQPPQHLLPLLPTLSSLPSQFMHPSPLLLGDAFVIRLTIREPTLDEQADKTDAQAPTECFSIENPLLDQVDKDFHTSPHSPNTKNSRFVWTVMPRAVLPTKGRAVAFHPLYATTLRELDASNCMLFTGGMALDCLETCAGLVKFVARAIDANEIVERAGVDEDTSTPWPCRGRLRYLEARFSGMVSVRRPAEGSAQEAHTRFQHALRQHMCVFERLGELTQLEELRVGCPRRLGNRRVQSDRAKEKRRYSRSELMFTLITGLGCLDGLKRLRTLGVRGLGQEATLQDALWMRDNWPALEKVEGRMHPQMFLHHLYVKTATGGDM